MYSLRAIQLGVCFYWTQLCEKETLTTSLRRHEPGPKVQKQKAPEGAFILIEFICSYLVFYLSI